MNRKLLLPALLFLALAANSCKKGDNAPDNTADFFAVGTYACECSGNCARVFKLQDNQVYKKVYPLCITDDLSFPNTPESADKVPLMQNLEAAFPAELNTTTETIFGCPDCGDWGGYIVIVQKNGVIRRWNIDTQTQSLPEWLKPYQQQIATTIQAFQ